MLGEQKEIYINNNLLRKTYFTIFYVIFQLMNR